MIGPRCGTDVDWLAVEWVVTERIRLPINAAERREVVRRLAGKLTSAEIGELLGIAKRSVDRILTSIRNERRELIAS
ncbi:hypothetical protein MM1218R_01478 [Mycobacterium marinum]|uniref:Uncharacterized protein n=1 Tax=Mycobacterium marinum TaxID=1781 RepID=A0A3E2MW38_MYCMR|nr:hypothetical protein [Mycobacterium marinum]AXN43426.1 hypothetical protein MM1218R_01478 [Mycobacterium marinum]RFZ11522.1 hypothetical protein DE4381_01110 [Mycobacterium marinum]RFZ41361.1 hypothetical protein DAVIS_02630 [Mycobacterium marinum]GJO50171.1 hypothetical protein NJB1604_35710 [Mycobacterium marinum]